MIRLQKEVLMHLLRIVVGVEVLKVLEVGVL